LGLSYGLVPFHDTGHRPMEGVITKPVPRAAPPGLGAAEDAICHTHHGISV